VALLLFSGVLLAVGIHHLVATGTCSSTGYSSNYGPVPYCPSGTGWWFAFVFGGIFGCLIGAFMARSLGLVFAGIFGAIGVGALTITLDKTAKSGTKIFGAIFGGSFALVGGIAAIAVIGGALSSLRRSTSAGPSGPHGPAKGPRRGFRRHDDTQKRTITKAGRIIEVPEPASASLGVGSTTSSTANSSGTSFAPVNTDMQITPLNLLPGLEAAKSSAAKEDVNELAKLAELHQNGSLTDAEYATAKAKLLGQM
jgi:hypothetical protein